MFGDLEELLKEGDLSKLIVQILSFKNKIILYGDYRVLTLYKLFKQLLHSFFTALPNYLFFSCKSETKGIFHNFWLDPLLVTGERRKKQLSKYQIEELLKENKIDEWDVLNHDLSLTVP